MKIADQPHHRVTVTEMSEEQINAFIESVRKRRAEPIRVYEEAVSLARSAKKGKIVEKLDKKAVILKKKLASLDKLMNEVEKKAHEVKVIMFEIEELGGLDEEIRISGSAEGK
jgi:hypothetical protein